jgi:putative ABC transport system substrate-binding protein
MLLPAIASAQTQRPARPYRIGILGSADDILQQNLRERGYVDGRDIVFEIRDAAGRSELLDGYAQELVRMKVDVIVVQYPAAAFSAKRATTTIPIVMMNSPDPVQMGLVASLAKPGGNITGTTTLTVDLSVKQLELFREALPRASLIAILWNPDNPWHPLAVKALQARSVALGLQLQAQQVRDANAFEDVFRAMVKDRAQGVLVLADPMTFEHRQRLAELALKHSLPLMGNVRRFGESGGLMSFWADRNDLSRRAASYIDRILKGAKPGDLPIEQPTKFELIVNLKTAKALGITVPQSLLLRADELIQ